MNAPYFLNSWSLIGPSDSADSIAMDEWQLGKGQGLQGDNQPAINANILLWWWNERAKETFIDDTALRTKDEISVDTNNNEHRHIQLANIGEPQPEDREVISSSNSFFLLVVIVYGICWLLVQGDNLSYGINSSGKNYALKLHYNWSISQVPRYHFNWYRIRQRGIATKYEGQGPPKDGYSELFWAKF